MPTHFPEFKFSSNSQAKLSTCHQDLQEIANTAIKFYDFSVVAGYRDELTQTRYYNSGVSKTPWPKSKHNTDPSLAMDIYPYHPIYGSLTEDKIVVSRMLKIRELKDTSIHRGQMLSFIREEYCIMSGVIHTVATHLGIKLRWGGDWDGDRDRLDQTFHDLAHFELKL